MGRLAFGIVPLLVAVLGSVAMDGGTGNEIPYEIGLDSLEPGRDSKWFN